MRILNISAQKPDGTGGGTFLAQTVAAEVAAGHDAAPAKWDEVTNGKEVVSPN